MKQKILFWAVMLWMACIGVQAETASLQVLGQEVDLSLGGSAQVGNITLTVKVSNSQKYLMVYLEPDEPGGNVINVPEGKRLFEYNGDDYQYIQIVLPGDLTVNTTNYGAFAFYGRPTNILNVSFYSSTGDVTLTLHHTSDDDYINPLFYLAYADVKLNESDTRRVNMNWLNYDENGSIFRCTYPATLRLGYGDYHIVNQFDHSTKGGTGISNYNFFNSNLTVVGLQDGDNIYYAEPYIGVHVHEGGYAIVDCNDKQIMGEVNLTYLPQGYQSIEGSEAEWRIDQSCEDGIKLYVYGAGDMSEISEDKLGWKKYNDFITQIEIRVNMYAPFTALPENAFEKMKNLQYVQFYQTDDLNKLPYGLFFYCKKLETVDLSYYGGNLKEIGRYAFGSCESLKSFTIPETVEKIGGSVFQYCAALTSITIPDKVTDFGAWVFKGCANLTTVTLPKDLTYIGYGMFSDCKKLSSITLPSSVTSIQNFAFSGCEQLKSISLPDGIRSIGISAFSGTSLTEVTLPKGLEKIAIGAFAVNSLEKVTIPAEMGEVKETANTYNKDVSFLAVNDIRFGGDAAQWLGYDRSWLMTHIAEDSKLYFGGEEVKKVWVPESITKVPANAFRHVGSIKELTLPSGMTEIGAGAFAGCSNMYDIYSYAWNPPTVGEGAFDVGASTIVQPWYTAATNYAEDKGWRNLCPHFLGFSDYELYDMWPSQMLDDYAKVMVIEGQEALGSVQMEVPENDRTGGFKSDTEITVKEGGSVTLIAKPAENCRFVKWERLLSDWFDVEWHEVSYDASYTTQTKEVVNGWHQNIFRAVFAKDSFDITVTVNGIDPELVEIHGAGRYGRGDDATLTFTLKDEDHYSFMEWIIDKKSFEENETLVFEGISGNHNVQINFKGNMYTVTATVIPEGAGVVKGQGEYEYGSMYGLLLEPAEGWVFKEWRDGIALDEKSNNLTGVVYGDINIEVELVRKVQTYTVTFLDWDATLLLVEQVEEGLDAKGPETDPEREGYQFVGWSKPITNITADLTVIAQYEKKDPTGNLSPTLPSREGVKVLRNGVLYIERNGQTYSVTGTEVK